MEISVANNINKIKDRSYHKYLTKVSYYLHCDLVKIESFEFETSFVKTGVVMVELVSTGSAPQSPIRWERHGIDAIVAEKNWELLSQLLDRDFHNYIAQKRIADLALKIKNKLGILR
jgi:hypothetical protein